MGIFFGKIFRAILMFLDDAVYGLAEMVYRLFIRIAETGIFSQASIQEFAGRIYFFLGLAMLFKVSISIIDYIMNPDSVKDNKVGASKLLKNIVTILVGIVAIPYVFEAAYGLQRIILQDNVIGNLILGVKYTDADKAESFTHRAGDEMSFTVYNAFFHINEDLDLPETCQNGAWEDAEGNFKDECFPTGESSSDLNAVKDKYIAAYNAKERNELTKFDVMNATVKYDGDDEFVFSYMYVVATAAGAFLCYILLLFCFDIAVRSVKLGFLQLIAPIPLISKIDPKKGDEVFSKWVKEVTSTYLVLFLRLVAIYFAIYIVSSLTDSYNIVKPTDADEKNLFVNVFMIFGVLLFVKDLPKLVETLTGVKIDGTLSLNKRMRSVPLVGNKVSDAGALLGRTAGHLGAGLWGQTGKKAFNWTGGKIKDKYGASSHLKPFVDKFKNGAGGAYERANKFMGGHLSQIGGDIASTMGTGHYAKKIDKQVEMLKKVAGFKDALKKQADFDTSAIKHSDIDGLKVNNAVKQFMKDDRHNTTKKMKQAYDDLVNSGTATAEQIATARTAYEEAQKLSITNGTTDEIRIMKENLASFISDNSSDLNGIKFTDDKGDHYITEITDSKAGYDAINYASIAANNEVVQITNTDHYEHSKVALNAQPKK